MPKFTDQTPRAPAKFMGIDFSVPQMFAEGHALTPNEAKFVNRQLSTVIGNTYGGRIRKALEEINEDRAKQFKAKTYTGPVDEKGKPAAATVADLNWDHQKEFEALFADYELGVSNRGSAGEPKDPVAAAAYAIASAKVRDLIKSKGRKVPDFYKAAARDPATYNNRFNELVAEYTAANAWVGELAKSQVEAMNAAGQGALPDELDLGADADEA